MNYAALSEQQREHIISSGLELMDAITSAFGPDEGIATWEKVSEAMGDTFKHELFMAMLGGRTSSGISLRWKNIGNAGKQYVQFIKTLRNITGWGLKEAKDMTEQLPAEIIKGGKPEDVKAAAEKLKAAGATVEMK